MICADCNKELAIGDWPFCPHSSTHEGIGMLGGFHARYEHNIGPEPVYVTSFKQLENILSDKDGRRGYPLEMRGHQISQSQARDRMMARRERAAREAAHR